MAEGTEAADDAGLPARTLLPGLAVVGVAAGRAWRGGLRAACLLAVPGVLLAGNEGEGRGALRRSSLARSSAASSSMRLSFCLDLLTALRLPRLVFTGENCGAPSGSMATRAAGRVWEAALTRAQKASN